MADLAVGEDDYLYDDDGSFIGYVPTTIDPGPSILIATTTFCVLCYALLPCMVTLCNRMDRRRKHKGGDVTTDDEEDDDDSGSRTKRQSPQDEDDDNVSIISRSSYASSVLGSVLDSVPAGRKAKHRLASRRKRAVIEKRAAELDHQEGSVVAPDSSSTVGGARTRCDSDDDYQPSCSAADHLSMSEVSIHDAVDERGGGGGMVRKPQQQEELSCCGPSAWWRPWFFARVFDKLLSIAEWDHETRRIYKLAFPYVLQALLEGASEAARVAIVGQLIGTREVAAYVIVDLFVGLTSQFLQGFSDSLTSLLSHSMGAGNRKLTGQYVQLSMILFVVCYSPFIVMWFYLMKDTLIMLGYDEQTAEIGRAFAIPYLFSELIGGVSQCLHTLLDVIDHEVASTILVAVGEIGATLVVLVAALIYPDLSLESVGFIYLVAEGVALAVTTILVARKGWIRRYYCGLFGTFALCNWKAVKMMFKTSSALSVGYLLAYGEWEILTFFAKFLGPAEVTAWGILGTLWDVLELVTEAVGDAAEVRVSILLGEGKPDAARISAYKSIFVAFVFSLLLTSILFIAGEDLASWMTADPVLQDLITELIPLFGIGNIGLTMGTMAWTLVGAQGRYRLATAIGVAGTFLVQVPLAAIFTVAFRINLQGQTAAVVIGYVTSGMVTTAILLRSDWPKLSAKVVEHNKALDVDIDVLRAQEAAAAAAAAAGKDDAPRTPPASPKSLLGAPPRTGDTKGTEESPDKSLILPPLDIPSNASTPQRPSSPSGSARSNNSKSGKPRHLV